MNETATETPVESSRPATREPGPPGSSRGLVAWSLLFGALATAAGHGVFLVAALRLAERGENAGTGLDYLYEVGRGRLGAVALLWLMASPALAVLTLVLRRQLTRTHLIGPLAILSALATAGAFALYLTSIVRVA